MKKAFICPHCKEAAGWCEITPIRGHYVVYYGASGQFDITYYPRNLSFRTNSINNHKSHSLDNHYYNKDYSKLPYSLHQFYITHLIIK